MSDPAVVEQVPVLHVRGTNYQIGLAIGRTFGSLIQTYVNEWKHFPNVLIPLYESVGGRKIYEATLATCEERFPQYVREMRGISEGANIPFEKIFLLHIDTIIEQGSKASEDSFGCTGILSNMRDGICLGHTEDAPPEMVNRYFIVSAQVLDDSGKVIEDFATLTYPGYLPGFTMGYNRNGIVFCINALALSRTYSGRTPVIVISRALLAAKNMEDLINILKDKGMGIADGFSLNVASVNEEKGPLVANIEIAPNRGTDRESEVDVLYLEENSTMVHCNRYLRKTDTKENPSQSSWHRHAAIEKLPPPTSEDAIRRILSDRSDTQFPVFRSAKPGLESKEKMDENQDYGATVAVGIFNIEKRTWSIYNSPPASSEPVVVLPLQFK